jgi:uncharacterized phage-associated protein
MRLGESSPPGRQRLANGRLTKMAEPRFDPHTEEELRRLALLPDEAIDTSDAPEVGDWRSARRAAFYQGKIEEKQYDVRALANWFLDRLTSLGISASNLSLNKLLYFAVERSLVERYVLLTPAKIEAWDHGPVFREVYHAFKDGDNRTIRNRIEVYSIADRCMKLASAYIEPDDERFLEDIVLAYGQLTASKLRNISHEPGNPWHAVWSRAGRSNLGMEISATVILAKAPLRRQTYGRS